MTPPSHTLRSTADLSTAAVKSLGAIAGHEGESTEIAILPSM